MTAFNGVKILVIYSEVIIVGKHFPVIMSIVIFVILFSLDNPMLKLLRQKFNKFVFIPNRSLGPISSGDVKVFSCSPESKESLPLIHGSHKT